MIYLLGQVLVWVGSYLDTFVHFLHFSLYVYTYLRIGPYGEELIHAPDNQEDPGGLHQHLEDLGGPLGRPEAPKSREDHEELTGSRPSTI